MIQLHNTLSRQVEEFVPQDSHRVTIYTCGPTVYNYLHVGNWVAYVRWDILVRTLRDAGLTVDRVMNITDVGHLTSDADEGEDKMEKGARREGKTAWDIAKLYTEDFLQGMSQLNLIMPEHISKATDYIQEQINLVKVLEAKGFTYIIDDGVYFDTSKFPTYADFAHLDLDALRAGARVEYNDEKRNPSDFALWKFTPKGEKRDMEWESPWGKGFPGWHLECSAMAMKLLGPTIDIHTGGIDHIPVHHTNEIAQSEAATGKRFANYWLHANFLQVDGTKISKSLDNGFTLSDLAEKGYTPLDFRMFVLQSHYRTESNFTWDNLSGAKARLEHWREIARLRHQARETEAGEAVDTNKTVETIHAHHHAAQLALQNDLNTPEALRSVEDAFSAVEQQGVTVEQLGSFNQLLEWIDDTLGLDLVNTTPDISAEQKQLIEERQKARDEKDWQLSDELREKLEADGVHVRDTPAGPIWY